MTYRLAYALTKLLEQVNAAAPHRSKASDGWIGDASHFAQGSASDHNPWVTWNGEGIVTAVDITHDPANGCDVWKLAQAIAASRDPRLKYLIWTGHEGGAPGILSSTVSPWTWRVRRYDDHPHHLHLSVDSDKGSYDSTAPWHISAGAPASAIPHLPASPAGVDRAKTARLQVLLELVPDGLWGNGTDGWAMQMRTAARAHFGAPIVAGAYRATAVQKVVDVVPDGDFGPRSKAALKVWIVQLQRLLGVSADGIWGPGTEAAFTKFRNANRNKF